MKRTIAAVAAAMAVTALPAAGAPAPAQSLGQGGLHAVVQYTEYGVPHITAADFGGLGYGYGYAAAKDNICVLAQTYLTVDGQRSRYFGPTASASIGMGTASDNLNSDLYYQRVNDSHIVDQLMRAPAPTGPAPQVADLVRGYVAGYDRYLRDTGVDGIADPACHGQSWVRPISEIEVYRHVYAMTSVTGSGMVMDGVATAQPPAAQPPAAQPPAAQPPAADGLNAAMRAVQGGDDLGSNAIAVGADGTSGGGSVLLANPHYPWQGARRLWQSQLTIPGRFSVEGASLLGYPLVMIGHNNDVAWSHTVSPAATFGLYQVPTVPGTPTSYLVDGRPEAMTSQQVSVEVRQADGSAGTVTRTLWSTRYGPVITTGPGGVPLPWGATAYSIRDANAGNLRALNMWLGLDQSRSTGDVLTALSRTQGDSGFNTLAVDRAGNSLYADIQVVPNVTDALAASCNTALGKQVFPVSGISVLDGGRSACAWGVDPDAVQPGTFGVSRLPSLTRRDYVANFNDSAWLTNPAAPITGYPRGVGDIGTARSFRTQQGLLAVADRLAGADGLPGKGFSLPAMQQILFSDTSRVAQLAAADTARMCASFPDGLAPSSNGPVAVGAACSALSSWSGKFTVDSRGSLLFQRFAQRLATAAGVWRTPFNPADPLHTPNSLDTGNNAVRTAFGDAAADLTAAGVALDAPLGAGQSVTRDGVRIPLPGAPDSLGVLNVVSPVWNAKQGNVEVSTGSSFIQVTQFDRVGPPKAVTLLTYSQSSDPTSPHYADQTTLFSAGRWVPERFTPAQILASPALRTVFL